MSLQSSVLEFLQLLLNLMIEYSVECRVTYGIQHSYSGTTLFNKICGIVLECILVHFLTVGCKSLILASQDVL